MYLQNVFLVFCLYDKGNLLTVSPAENTSRTGQASAERCHGNQIAFFQPAGPVQNVQSNGNAGSGGIAGGFNVRYEHLQGQFQFPGRHLDDPDIGLVGNNMLQVGRRDAQFSAQRMIPCVIRRLFRYNYIPTNSTKQSH